ncbi:MAG: diguanylate cyclase (GGDEF)-like protein, partial [Oleiphilaceae bacterium]
MSQSDHQLLIQSKPYLYASLLSGLLSFATLLDGQYIFAAQMAIFCLLLFVNRFKSSEGKNAKLSLQWFKQTSIALGFITIASLILGIESAKIWLYFIPLLVFFVFPFKAALWLVGAFSVISMFALSSTNQSLEYIQVSLNYLLYIGISCSLVYLRELRRRQLKPLRRTDNLTTAAIREHLDDDLVKEIQRSEREGSDLATMALSVDTICNNKLSSKEQDTVTINIGKLLHNNLRLFDSYYLWEHHEFLIVLPHTSSSQALKIANALRIQIRKSITMSNEAITVSIGVSGLNIGDDSGSLTFRATQALKETLEKSSNRTNLYREIEG